eukprot:1352720-Amorphochlora_amoeboformis.AAC.1
MTNEKGIYSSSAIRNVLTSRSFSKHDMAGYHVVSRYIRKVYPEARYYGILPGTTQYYRQGNLRAISGISSDLGHIPPHLCRYVSRQV